MVLSFMQGIDDGKPIFSTYLEALVQALEQRYVEAGCEVVPVVGSLQVSINVGTIVYDKTRYSVSAQNLTINPSDSYVRYDVVVWDYNNGTPILRVLEGNQTLQLSDGSIVYKTQRLSDTQIPLAVVRVRPGIAELTANDIFDTRVNVIAGMNINEVIDYMQSTGIKNKAYDSDLDGVLDVFAIPSITRDKITDFWSSPFWSNILDKPFESLSSDFSVDANKVLNIASVDWSKIANAPSFALDDLSNVSDSTILTKLKNVDGSGSGLDADTVDGLHASSFLRKDSSNTPSANNTYDFGSSSLKWRHGYFAGTVYANRLNGVWEDPDNDVSIAADNDYWIHVKNKARTIFKGVACSKLFVGGTYIEGSGSGIWPKTDNAYSFGTSSNRWKNGYFAGLVYSGGYPLIRGRNSTRNIFVSSSTPTAEVTNDIWIQI